MKKRDWFFGFLLLAATLLVYAPALNGKPIWDDFEHLPSPGLRSWHGLWLMWVRPGVMAQYYPLVYSVLWAGYKIWGEAWIGYHLLNILLHVCSALLLVRITRKLNIPGGWLAAFLFALHPVNVESVAWISEIKNTLSCALLLGSVLFYLDFDRDRDRRSYIAALVLFAAGLMAKSVIATMPAALLVVFWWQRGKLSWRRDTLPLAPFFVTGIASGWFTAWAEKKISGAEGTAFHFSIVERCLIAARAFWFYLGKLFWPSDTGLIYPRWTISASVWGQDLFVLAVLALFACLWLFRKQRGPLAAMLLFAGMAFPALGFLNINYFIYSFVADHFQYHACAAVMVLVSAGASTALGRLHGWQRTLACGLCVTMLAGLSGLSWQQSSHYTDAETSYRSMIAKNPACWVAYTNLGDILASDGRMNEALDCETKALQLDPEQAKTRNSIALVLMQQNRTGEALPHLEKAVALKPRFAEAYNNLGNAYTRLRRIPEATASYEKAIQLSPNYPYAHENYAKLLSNKGDFDGALEHYRKALDINPDNAESLHGLGVAYFQKGRIDDAIAQYRQALLLRPDYAEAHNSLGAALREKGNVKEGIEQFELALKSAPNHARALNNLAWVLATCTDATLRNGPRAVELARQLNHLPSGPNAQSLMTLAAAYAESGRFVDAIETARQALQLARNANNAPLVSAITAQMNFYQSQRPYRENPRR